MHEGVPSRVAVRANLITVSLTITSNPMPWRMYLSGLECVPGRAWHPVELSLLQEGGPRRMVALRIELLADGPHDGGVNVFEGKRILLAEIGPWRLYLSGLECAPA